LNFPTLSVSTVASPYRCSALLESSSATAAFRWVEASMRAMAWFRSVMLCPCSEEACSISSMIRTILSMKLKVSLSEAAVRWMA